MRNAIKASFAYWAIIFGLGFVLGIVRTLWLEPYLGSAVCAVAIELPFMLAASWFGAGRLVARFGVERRGPSAAMGGIAFVLLLAAEAGVGIGLMGEIFTQWLAGLFEGAGLLGLCGQIAFALFPLMQAHKS
jgi:hypothetical protein